MILLTTTLSLRAKRESSYVRRAPSAQAVFDRNCAVNQVVRAYGHSRFCIDCAMDSLVVIDAPCPSNLSILQENPSKSHENPQSVGRTASGFSEKYNAYHRRSCPFSTLHSWRLACGNLDLAYAMVWWPFVSMLPYGLLYLYF
jgi:hypothetical protein